MRDLGNTWGIADALNGLGMVAFQRGDLDAACLRCSESLGMMREIEDRRAVVGPGARVRVWPDRPQRLTNDLLEMILRHREAIMREYEARKQTFPANGRFFPQRKAPGSGPGTLRHTIRPSFDGRVCRRRRASTICGIRW
jgi:hypothetical protein